MDLKKAYRFPDWQKQKLTKLLGDNEETLIFIRSIEATVLPMMDMDEELIAWKFATDNHAASSPEALSIRKIQKLTAELSSELIKTGPKLKTVFPNGLSRFQFEAEGISRTLFKLSERSNRKKGERISHQYIDRARVAIIADCFLTRLGHKHSISASDNTPFSETVKIIFGLPDEFSPRRLIEATMKHFAITTPPSRSLRT